MQKKIECEDYFLSVSDLSLPQYERINNELILREVCIDVLGSKVTKKDIQHILSMSGFKITRYLVGSYYYKYIIQRFGLRDIGGGKYNCNLYEKIDYRVCLKSYMKGIKLATHSFQTIIDELRKIIKESDNKIKIEKAYKLITTIRLYQYTYLEKGVNVATRHVKHTEFEVFKNSFDFNSDEHLFLERMKGKYQNTLFNRWFTNIIPLSIENFKYYLLSFNKNNIVSQLGLYLIPDNSNRAFVKSVKDIRSNIMNHHYIDISWQDKEPPDIPKPLQDMITRWQKHKDDNKYSEDVLNNETGSIYFFTFEENGFYYLKVGKTSKDIIEYLLTSSSHESMIFGADSFYYLEIKSDPSDERNTKELLSYIERKLINQLKEDYNVKKNTNEVFIVNGYKDPLLRTKKALAKSLGISVKRLHQYLRLVSFQGAKDKPNRVLQVKRATRH